MSPIFPYLARLKRFCALFPNADIRLTPACIMWHCSPALWPRLVQVPDPNDLAEAILTHVRTHI